MAATFDASIIAHPVVMLRPHPLMYSTRGFIRFFRIEKVVDERTQQLVAYRVVGGWNFAPRTIWLDGRPHPPEYAEHQYNGFSTGRWERGMLVVTTTHLKKGFHRRNGVPVSTSARLTEYFIRHGNRLIHVQFTEDTAYLEEPFIRTTYFILNHELHGQIMNYVWDIAEEASGWGEDYVPHFPLGTRHTEFADLIGIPYEEVALGGAAHTYPEFRERLKELMNESGASGGR